MFPAAPPTQNPMFAPQGAPITPAMYSHTAGGGIGAFFTKRRLKIMLFILLMGLAIFGYWWWQNRVIRFRLMGSDKQAKAVRFMWQGKPYRVEVPVSGFTKVVTNAGTITVLATKFLDPILPTQEGMVEARIAVEDTHGNIIPKHTQTVILI